MNSSPFDAVAPGYDTDFENNVITQTIRPIILNSALEYFKRGHHILEINCGTGTDAIAFANRGIEVTATDQSREMIHILTKKLASTPDNMQTLVHPQVLEFDNLTTIHKKFDGVFSNFGGLNCSTDIGTVMNNVSNLLKPGAFFFACLLNKFCLWETASFLARGKFTQAFRRFYNTPLPARIGAMSIEVQYYTPQGFARMLLPSFRIKKIYGVNILSPSPNSQLFSKRHPVLVSTLLKIDDLIRHQYLFRSLGDHFIIIAQKRE